MYSRFLENYFLFTNEAVIPHFAIDFLMSSVETRDGSKEIFSQFEIGLILYIFTPFSDFNRFSTILASQEQPMPSSLKVTSSLLGSLLLFSMSPSSFFFNFFRFNSV